MFLERKLVRYRRRVLTRFFKEWGYHDLPTCADSESSDEPEQANSSDDESLESDDDVTNVWDLVWSHIVSQNVAPI